MRIWIDMTAPAHVLVLRPIIERLRAQGHEVEVTARDYAQTLELLELHGMEHTPFGRHGGASRAAQAGQAVQRTRRCAASASGRGFDLAIAHGSNDLAIASRLLGIPEANMHDYEFAVAAAPRRLPAREAGDLPGLGPARAAAALRRRAGEALPVSRASRRSTTSPTSRPTPTRSSRLGVDTERVVVVVRPPPDVSLYHRKSNPLFPQVLARVGTRARVSTPSCCRGPRSSGATSGASPCPR